MPASIRILTQRSRLQLGLLVLVGALACRSEDDDTAQLDSSAELADGGEDTVPEPELDAGEDGDAQDHDSEPAADAEQDASQTDAARPSTENKPCQTDADCDNEIYCDGLERCLATDDGTLVCRRASSVPCSAKHPCVEAARGCECSFPDADGDDYDARECGGDDCDDSSSDCRPGGVEICDDEDRDEDCDAATFNKREGNTNVDGDKDGDGFVDQRCRNRDPDTGQWHHGPDCNDANNVIKPGSTEACNYLDDNCDGHIDELRDMQTGALIERGLMVSFLPDLDGDLRGDQNASRLRACDFYQPRGHILVNEDDATDCDDRQASVYGGAPELCDGKDNDCDGRTDADDLDLRRDYDFTGTTLVCEAGAWTVPVNGCPQDKLWCPGDPIERGCARDATRLSSCRACDTSCQFSCGRTGCDEIVQIATGDDHACALTREGRVACWGRGEGGRLGNDAVSQSSVPTYVLGISDVKGIAAGGGHTCAIVGDARDLYCWGRNESGQLGNSDVREFVATPVPVLRPNIAQPRVTGVVQVGAGAQHTCAVLSSGELLCFGQTAGGLLGDGSLAAGSARANLASRLITLDPADPFPLPDYVRDAKLLAVGDNHSCIVTRAGNVECWGSNALGQLGQEPTAEATGFLVPVPGLRAVTAIAAGSSHTCVVSEGAVLCWGADSNLQLGRGATPEVAERWVPKAVPALAGIASVTAGAQFTCAATDDLASCWGANNAGQLGPAFTGTRTNLPVATPLAGLRDVHAGSEYSCALTRSGSVHCWGANVLGQLGNGSLERVIRTPRQIQAVQSSIP